MKTRIFILLATAFLQMNAQAGTNNATRFSNEVLNMSIHGKVVNENGEPVVVSVTVKGSNTGTVSDANGEFTLSNVPDDATLVITATNIVTKEVKLNGKPDITIRVTMNVNS